MGAEQSARRDPRYLNADAFEVVLSQNSGASQSCQRFSRPSVSEFSSNPERYPDFVLVLVLSTGKMEVMTRLEARTSSAKVKIVSTPNESGSSDNSGFFQQSSDEDTILEYLRTGSTDSRLYFDTTTGRFGICKKEDQHRHRRDGLIWLA